MEDVEFTENLGNATKQAARQPDRDEPPCRWRRCLFWRWFGGDGAFDIGGDLIELGHLPVSSG